MSFGRYREFKESGVEWLDSLPAHWEIRKLKSLFRLVKRQENASAPVLSVYRDFGVIEKSSRDDNFNKTPDDLSLYQTVNAGDLVVNKMKAWQGSLGISCHNGITSPDYVVFSPHHSLNSAFIHYFLRSAQMPAVYKAISNGIRPSQWRLEPEKFLQLPFPVPPREEQSAISSFLDEETSRIDALVKKNERLLTLIEEKRRAVISDSICKGLRPGSEMKSSGIAWLGGIPAHWEIKRLRHIASLQSGLPKGRKNDGADVREYPYLRVANVQDGYVDLEDVLTIEASAEDVIRFSLRKGDVLMNEGGDFDKLGRGTVWEGQIEPCLHQNHVFAVRPFSKYDPYWIAAITRSDYAKWFFVLRSKQTTNLASISSSNIKDMPVILPPPDEQKEILDYISRKEAVLDAVRDRTLLAIEYLRQHRASIIAAAVTGRIDVRGKQSAKVYPFPPRQRRNALAAEVIRQFHNDNTFGRTKAQKVFYLLDAHLGATEFEGHYERWIAGPYDAAMMRSVAADIESAGWFREIEDGGRYLYRPLTKAYEVRGAFTNAWAERSGEIEEFLRLLRPLDTQQAEVIATLYAAWNDLLLRGEEVSDAKLLTEVTTNWHEAKKAIPERAWMDGLRWLRQHGVVPKGTGSQTIQQMSLGL